MKAIEKLWQFSPIEQVFVAIAVFFGSLLIFVTPPFQVADEYLHFYRAFQISEGQWIAQQQMGDCYGYSRYFEKETCLGGKLPRNLLTTVRESSRVDLRFHPEHKQSIRDIFAVLNLPLNRHDRLFIKFNTTGLHPPIPYLPQAIGIAIGNSLNFSPLLLLYLGRFSNLVTWIILSSLTLKITPIGKLLFFLLLLTPMSLFQASSLSADALTNGLAFFWMAMILHRIFNQDAQIKSYRVLIIISTFLCLSKLAYFPLLLLPLLIPIQNRETRTKSYRMKISIFAINLLAIILWSSIVDRIYVPLSAGIFPDRQIEFILKHPIEFTGTILRTFSQEGLDYLHQFIGVLGWIDTPLPWFQVGSYFAIIILVAVGDSNANMIISLKQKWAIAAIVATNAIVLSILAYLWNPIGAKMIGGLQGRYFIPLSPLFFFLFYHPHIQLNLKKLPQIVFSYSLFSWTLTLAILIHRYYIE
jgi:uncharacterized membrane protein